MKLGFWTKKFVHFDMVFMTIWHDGSVLGTIYFLTLNFSK